MKCGFKEYSFTKRFREGENCSIVLNNTEGNFFTNVKKI